MKSKYTLKSKSTKKWAYTFELSEILDSYSSDVWWCELLENKKSFNQNEKQEITHKLPNNEIRD